jgi:class 3 adenylate cyclase/tetratricopeptide (TPR) repeat protein
VSERCPACGGSGLPRASRFCPFCGRELRPDRGPQAPRPYTPLHLVRDVFTSESAREGERKEVTVLFADIAGSLAMAEALDPEDVHAIMDGFFVHALHAVHAEGGTINQFRGDGFMALFGAPRAREEDVARALRAALAIRAATAAYGLEVSARFGVPMQLRMGLHTGVVWVGTIGLDLRRDYTAEGPTVGLAARLERSARPGQILLSQDTAMRGGASFEIRELGSRRFRGARRSVRVFELLGPGLQRGRFDARRALGLSPFVGREAELAWLARAAAPGARAAVIVIEGEAGIGKSRLIHEHLAARGARALEMRCRESETTNAYAPWLRMLVEWPPELPGAEAAADLAQRFGGDASRVSGTRSEFVAELALLLAGVARGRSLPIVLEDAHWLDPTSRRVLGAIARDPSLAGVALLLTLRADLDRAPEPIVADARLALGPLASQERAALCRSLLAPLAERDACVALAVQRGGGNPLFLEEISRALGEGEEDARRVTRLELERRGGSLRVPDTLRGVISARIDALPDREKRLLLCASVAGAPFDRALLQQIDETESGRDPRTLAALVENGLLEPARDPGTFDFRHGLMREVAYSQLLLSRRRALHGACAEALVQRGLAVSAEGASLVGHHYRRAGLDLQAATYLSVAGRAYLRLHSIDEAAAHLRLAWDLSDSQTGLDPSVRVSTGVALAAALNGLDRASEAGEVLDALAGQPLEREQRRDVARALIEGGWVRFSERNQVDEGRRLIERGLALLEGSPQGRRTEMGAQAYLVRVNTLDGEISRAVAAADHAIALALELGDDFFRTFALGSKASALCQRGALGPALEACREAVRLADAAGSEVAVALAQSFLAEVCVWRGHARAALRAAERARRAGERSLQTGAIYHAAGFGGEAWLLLGEPEKALEDFERLAAINPSWPSTLLLRARGLLAVGRFEEAAAAASECLERCPPRLTRARALCAIGRALAHCGAEGPALGMDPLQESIALCEQLELWPHLAHAESALAVLCAKRGDPGEAEHHRSRAAEIYGSCGMRRHAARTKAERSQFDGSAINLTRPHRRRIS